MSLRHPRHIRRWHDETLVERIRDLTGPEVAVVCIRAHRTADERDKDRTVWRAVAWSSDLRYIPVNLAVSQLLVHLIRDHYPGTDWSQPWDYHVDTRQLFLAWPQLTSNPATAKEAV
jgi:hypothetical protein